MLIYVVLSPTNCGYDDYCIEKIFKNKEDAQSFVENEKAVNYYKIEEWCME